MSKFKVGDRVVVVANSNAHYFDIGEEVTINGYDEREDEYWCENDDRDAWWVKADEAVSVVSSAPNTLTLGQPYTSENGHKWECVGIKGEEAWLAGIYRGEYGTAYRFKLDGTPICLSYGSGANDYRIVFEPVRETVTIPFLPSVDHKGEWWSANSLSEVDHVACGGYSCKVTVETIDGKPDWSTAKVEAAQ